MGGGGGTGTARAIAHRHAVPCLQLLIDHAVIKIRIGSPVQYTYVFLDQRMRTTLARAPKSPHHHRSQTASYAYVNSETSEGHFVDMSFVQ